MWQICAALPLEDALPASRWSAQPSERLELKRSGIKIVNNKMEGLQHTSGVLMITIGVARGCTGWRKNWGPNLQGKVIGEIWAVGEVI